MNKLTNRFIADCTGGVKDKAFGIRFANRYLEACGEVVLIEDVPWSSAYLESDSSMRKFCFTRRYQFESGDIFEIDGRRAGHPQLEPLQINPLVLSTKAA